MIKAHKCGKLSTALLQLLRGIACLKKPPILRMIICAKKKLDRIYNRQRFYVEGKHQEVPALYRQTKKDARADRKKHIPNQFQQFPDDHHRKKVWKAINYLKKDCKPSYSKMRNAQGRLVPVKERVETIATCLQDQHWSNHCGQGPLPNDQIIGDIPHCDSSLFSLSELDEVLEMFGLGNSRGQTK